MARMAENPGEPLWNLFRIVAWTGAVIVVLAPPVAMQFTDEVNWTTSDFVFAGVLIGGTGLTFELTLRRARSNAYRLGVCLVLAASFLTIWINGAVGIIGSENEMANLLYGLVLLVALVGSIFAGFRPLGMAWTMAAAALVHALVPVAAWALGWSSAASLLAPEVPISTAVFAAIWLAAAGLFRNAARAHP